LAHGDNLLLPVAPPRLVASAAVIGGVTIRENPDPSMGAGKVLPLILDRAEHDGVVVGELLGSLAGGTVIIPKLL
jgi:hypothetical protein